MVKAQRFADRFVNLNWPTILDKYAKRVNPQMRDILHDRPYYWVSAQSEYSTDILFKTRQDLCELYPQLLSHSTLCFGAREVMNFLGRKLHGKFEGEIVSDLSSLVCRRTGGSRIKHRVKENWLKMYDKSGLVLRVETVINNPEEFRVRKQVLRKGKPQTEWVAMRKGVAYLFRYREVSLQANGRYLDALAVVDDPTNANGTSTASPPPKRMRQAVAAPVSIRSHDTTLNYSKASWPVTTACEGSRIATSGHGLHQRFISGPSGTIPQRKAPRSAAPFAASTLTA